jgi:hypothetical protein
MGRARMLVMQKDGKLGSSPCRTTKTRPLQPDRQIFSGRRRNEFELTKMQ